MLGILLFGKRMVGAFLNLQGSLNQDCFMTELQERSHLKLVVILHDFEQFDPLVIQDLFGISRSAFSIPCPSCVQTNFSSLYVSRLPLVFILYLSSPSSPSYLHNTYSRSTLALLRIRTFVAPSGPQVLEEILLKVYTFSCIVVIN